METPSTVKDIVEQLLKLPQDLPCYFRPKYYGNVLWCDDVPINTKGISIMEGSEYTDNKENVTFLV
jgi:hypothetical protein